MKDLRDKVAVIKAALKAVEGVRADGYVDWPKRWTLDVIYQAADAILSLVAEDRRALVGALELAKGALENYSDVDDGVDGPKPNCAMRAIQIIDATLGKEVGK